MASKIIVIEEDRLAIEIDGDFVRIGRKKYNNTWDELFIHKNDLLKVVEAIK